MAGRTREQAQERADERKALAATLLPAGAVELAGKRGTLEQASVLDELFDLFKPTIADALPAMIDPDSFVLTVLRGMRTSKQAIQLMNCSRPSLFAALLEAARLGLTPFTDEAAIVPFWSSQEHQYTATFIPMWKGYKELFFRTGQVAGLAANLIYQRDDWDLAYGDNGTFWHRPALVDRDTGETIPRGVEGNIAIMSYCYVTFRDGTRTEVTTVTRGGAIEIRDNYSKAYAEAEKRWRDSKGAYGRDSFWHTDFDKAMRKSAVRAHTSVAPMSAELRTLVAIDQRDDTRAAVAAQAAPMPQMTPVVEGVDWSKTVGGATPGEVVDRQDGPGGEPDQGGEPAREKVTVTRGGKPAPPPNGQALANAKTRARLRGRFARADMAGDDHAQFRLVVIGMLVAGQYRKLDDDGQLTQAEAEYAISQFDNLQDRADRAEQALADALRAVYDRAIEQRDAALAEAREDAGSGADAEDGGNAGADAGQEDGERGEPEGEAEAAGQ
jgi:recombination protein RecT